MEVILSHNIPSGSDVFHKALKNKLKSVAKRTTQRINRIKHPKCRVSFRIVPWPRQNELIEAC